MLALLRWFCPTAGSTRQSPSPTLSVLCFLYICFFCQRSKASFSPSSLFLNLALISENVANPISLPFCYSFHEAPLLFYSSQYSIVHTIVSVYFIFILLHSDISKLSRNLFYGYSEYSQKYILRISYLNLNVH